MNIRLAPFLFCLAALVATTPLPLRAAADCTAVLHEISGAGAPPLRVGKGAGDALTAEFAAAAWATGYNLYRGDLGVWYSHGASGRNLCGAQTALAGAGLLAAALPAAAGSEYFLVTGQDAGGEGSAGWDGAGFEIPRAQNGCPAVARTAGLTLTRLGEYRTGEAFGAGAAEIVVARPWTDGLGGRHLAAYVTVPSAKAIDFVNLDNPAAPVRITRISLATVGGTATGGPTSIAVDPLGRGIAVAVLNGNNQLPGWVLLLDLSGALLATVPVGADPDMVIFTSDGLRLLVANEGEPNDAYTADPEGSVSVIDVSSGLGNPGVATARLAGIPTTGFVRHFGPNAAAPERDYEPEYITLSADGKTAWVALQEANAIAELDVDAVQFTVVRGLGWKDMSLAANHFDPSDSDGGIHLAAWPVRGLYLPDEIASFARDGRTYILTANEGDSRGFSGYNEESRVGALTLEAPLSAALKANDKLGRLKVTKSLGDADANNQYEALHMFGARSFSIFRADDTAVPVYDSGSAFEMITAARLPAYFNSDNDSNSSADKRCDDKGPEPEGITTGRVCGRRYAFITLERIGGVMAYLVDDPTAPEFAQYASSRNFSLAASDPAAGGIGPEGVEFVAAAQSPTGDDLLLMGNEMSGSVDIWSVVPVSP